MDERTIYPNSMSLIWILATKKKKYFWFQNYNIYTMSFIHPFLQVFKLQNLLTSIHSSFLFFSFVQITTFTSVHPFLYNTRKIIFITHKNITGYRIIFPIIHIPQGNFVCRIVSKLSLNFNNVDQSWPVCCV